MSFNADEMLKDLKELHAKVQDESKKIFKAACADFFTEFPEVKKIVWAQYTPYFNDGDACVFGISDVYFVKDDVEHYSPYDYEEHSFSRWSGAEEEYKPSAKLADAMKNFESILNHVDDFLESTFGDHVVVTVTADDISTSEYDHD